MVAENIRILGVVEVMLRDQTCLITTTRTFARSIVSRASFRSRSRRSTLVSEAPATPPPPNFEPTRFWKIQFMNMHKSDGRDRTDLVI